MRRFLVLFPLLWNLTACTTESSQIEDVGIDGARAELKGELKKSLDDRMQGKEILKENYLNKILDRTEFSVEEVDRSEASAKVKVKIKTVPLKVREALTDIMVKVDPVQENNFNVPDALALISKQYGLEPSADLEMKKTILLKKEGVWKAQAPAKPIP